MTDGGDTKAITYRNAGVDIDAKYAAVRGAKAAIDSTRTPGVLQGIGSFGSLFRLADAGKFRDPVLVASTDGVGTKLAVAGMAGRHDTVGQDIVNHCVNDILVMGARPLFFLDYVAMGRMDGAVVKSVIEGLAKACRENGCALVGGETAEMPDLYKAGDYDLEGTIVGVVEHDSIVDGSSVKPGDRLLGLRSSGLHTNGYTLARRILFDRAKLAVDAKPTELGGTTVADALLAVHRSYLRPIRLLLEARLVRALCHVTGGGFADNLPRVLPAGTAVRLVRSSWTPPLLFRFLVEKGRVPVDDAYRTWNMGIGMIVAVRAAEAARAAELLREQGEDPVVIGEVIAGDRTVDWA